MLEDLGFQQLVSEASHLKGGHLDHVYSNHDPNKFENEILMYSPYYTSMDHDAICLTLRQVVGKNEDRYIYEFSFSGVKLLYFPGPTYKKRQSRMIMLQFEFSLSPLKINKKVSARHCFLKGVC